MVRYDPSTSEWGYSTPSFWDLLHGRTYDYLSVYLSIYLCI